MNPTSRDYEEAFLDVVLQERDNQHLMAIETNARRYRTIFPNDADWLIEVTCGGLWDTVLPDFKL